MFGLYVTCSKLILFIFRNEDDFKENTSKDLLSKIAGLDAEIRELKDIINLALGHIHRVPGSSVTRGVLLYGSSGTGKTSVVNALAQHSKANVVNLSVANCYYKKSEDQLQLMFETVIKQEPSVVIIDDVDVLCPVKARGSDMEKQVASSLSSLFDTITDLDDSKVIVIATSSKPDMIDPLLRR